MTIETAAAQPQEPEPQGGSEAAPQARQAANDNEPERRAARRALTPLNWDEWSEREVDPPEMFLDPIISKKGLGQIYALPGVGKTFLALGMAAAIATGTDFLRWRCDRPRRVLYVDGEMPFYELQKRAKAIVAATGCEPPDPSYLRLISADQEPHGIPDLSTREGQDMVDEALRLGESDQVDVLFLDNLSVLMRTGSENSDEAWLPVQNWLLRLRQRGVSVVFLHHAGKSGTSRGTSKKEGPLNTVMALRKPKNYAPGEGARFEIHYEKNRDFYGEAAEPFQVQYSEVRARAVWLAGPTGGGGQRDKIVALRQQGLSVRQIEEAVGLSKSRVGEIIQQARADGLLPSQTPRKGVRSEAA